MVIFLINKQCCPTQSSDFRPAYGRSETAYQRRCVFIGTTNRTDYLRDETGNRQFWPIKLETVDLDAIEKARIGFGQRPRRSIMLASNGG